MIEFHKPDPAKKEEYEAYLRSQGERGCEYSFANLYLWGRQKAAFLHGQLVFFSQFNRKSVYLFPVGNGDKKAALEAVMADAKERGIPCRIAGLTRDDRDLLEQLFPGMLQYHYDRDSFDYIYDINDLADLKGRKYQKKRNHLNRFRDAYPDHTLEPVTDENIGEVAALVDAWYALRLAENPHGDFQLEQEAIAKALRKRNALGMEGLLLRIDAQPVAMTLGSRLNETTFDIHFEKALDAADGAYVAINNGFARYLREKYPEVLWLNREDDMGIEGLRKAKESYNPNRMVEKSWAILLEDTNED